jgi:hypothetical protein
MRLVRLRVTLAHSERFNRTLLPRIVLRASSVIMRIFLACSNANCAAQVLQLLLICPVINVPWVSINHFLEPPLV